MNRQYMPPAVKNVAHSSMLHVRPATLADIQHVWSWEKDVAVRENSLAQPPLARSEFEIWFTHRLTDPFSRVVVAVIDQNVLIGRAYLELVGSRGVIHIAIAPDQRGKGLSPALIHEATKYAFANSDVDCICGLMKPQSTAPIRAFEAAGYSEAGATLVDDEDALIYEISREAFGSQS